MRIRHCDWCLKQLDFLKLKVHLRAEFIRMDGKGLKAFKRIILDICDMCLKKQINIGLNSQVVKDIYKQGEWKISDKKIARGEFEDPRKKEGKYE